MNTNLDSDDKVLIQQLQAEVLYLKAHLAKIHSSRSINEPLGKNVQPQYNAALINTSKEVK